MQILRENKWRRSKRVPEKSVLRRKGFHSVAWRSLEIDSGDACTMF